MPIGTQTVITGARTTYGVNTNIHVHDVEDKIALLKPYKTPIEDFFFTTKFNDKEAKGERTKFEWFEDKFVPDVSTITLAGGASTENSVTVGNAYFRNFSVIFIPSTGERVLVTSGGGTTTINVKKVGAGNITVTAASAPCMRISESFSEAASKDTSLTVQEVNQTGYCQIRKRLISMSGRQQAGAQYTGSDWRYQWAKAAEEMKEEIERSYLYAGAAYDEASGGSGRTYSMGFQSLTTNVITYSGDLDESEFDDGMRQIFSAGGSDGSSGKLNLYCGGTALMYINKFLKARYELLSAPVEEYGVLTNRSNPKIFTYLHPMGEMNVCWHPQLKSMGSNTKFDKAILVVNPDNIKRRYCPADIKGSRKYRVEKGIETPGDDSSDAQYLADVGLQIELEETHGWFYQTGT